MPAGFPQPQSLRSLSRDGWLLFGTRCVRLFAYGLISIVLVFYLVAQGLSEAEVGTLLTLTLLGDTAIGLWITTRADRVGRRRMLLVGALLMVVAGIVFASTNVFVVLLIAATVGVISPSGNEVGPFLPIEQAALAQSIPAEQRTSVFAWYNLIGSVATACGSRLAGQLVESAQATGLTGAAAYQPVLLAYAALGGLLMVVFRMLSPAVEIGADHRQPASPASAPLFGLNRSRGTVARLSALFALDAFGGGFIMQSILAYWLYLRFGIDADNLGRVFFWANLLAGVSALAAGWLANRFGLINTMVFTHLPSNILLILIPLMPSAEWAVALLLLRFSISQMDVPTRQAYTVAVVAPDERSAAAGITSVARSLGAAISPAIATRLVANPALVSLPLFLAGGIKIVYDLILWWAFASTKPDHEVDKANVADGSGSQRPPSGK
jgi:MFS family permease